MEKTVRTFRKSKRSSKRLCMLTAYDYSTAKLMDEAGLDGILVGDSLGMTVQGYDNTLPVTMDEMVYHTRAVARGAKEALVVADMPFMSYQVSCEQAVENAGRLIQEGGAQAVKLEGGVQFCREINAITRASIPVMGHIGLNPQSINEIGGFRVRGKSAESAQRLLDDARALQAAGAFAIVLECIPAKLAEIITEAVHVVTIGIGSGSSCDGQILVYQDMLGMYSDVSPKFVKRFAEVGQLMSQAFHDYCSEVQNREFPALEHAYGIDENIYADLQ